MNWQNVSQQDEQPTAHGNDVDWEGDEGEDLEPTPKMKTCFPVFCLSIPPQEYWDELIQRSDYDPKMPLVSWVEVTSSSLPRAGVDGKIEVDDDRAGNELFTNFDTELAWGFYRAFLRPKSTSIRYEPFTHFTFLVIDEQCINAQPKEIIVCCDAPDYDEDNANGRHIPKEVRLPISTAMSILIPLEQLQMTLQEAVSPSWESSEAVSTIPPCTMKVAPRQDASEEECFLVRTYAEARKAKEQALRLRPRHGEWETYDEERKAQVFWHPMKQAEMSAKLYKQLEVMCRRRGAAVRFHSNTSDANEPEVNGES